MQQLVVFLILFIYRIYSQEVLEFPVHSVAHLTQTVLDEAGVADTLHFGSTRLARGSLIPVLIDDPRGA
jgi:hypothetical protein